MMHRTCNVCRLQAEFGFLTLNASALPALLFSLGDGASDRTMRFTGRPSALNAALGGATSSLRFVPTSLFST